MYLTFEQAMQLIKPQGAKACLYFGISRVRIMNSIEKKKYIRVPDFDDLIKFI
jgi:hypothetical protein